MRVFLAIEIPENLKGRLATVQNKLAPSIRGVRWEKTEKFHITLIFLGEVAEERISDLEEAVRHGVRGIEPFKISLSGLGCFPNERRPRVIWVGIEGEVETLIQLEKQLEAALTKFNFEFDQKKFHPHVTLGRVKGPTSIAEGWSPFAKATEDSKFEVREVTIMKSTLRPTGSVYIPLSRIPLES